MATAPASDTGQSGVLGGGTGVLTGLAGALTGGLSGAGGVLSGLLSSLSSALSGVGGVLSGLLASLSGVLSSLLASLSGVLAGLLSSLTRLTRASRLAWLSVLGGLTILGGLTVLGGLAVLTRLTIGAALLALLSARAASLFANGVAQTDARLASVTTALLVLAAGAVMDAFLFRSAVAAAAARARFGLSAIGAAGRRGAGRMLLLVLFAFFFAFLFALRIRLRVAFLELANLDRNLVAFYAQTDSQLGVASLHLSRSVEGLVRVVGTEDGGDFVAFRLAGEAGLLAAFQFAFEVVTAGFAFQSRNVRIAVARILINGHAILERKFLLGFALGARGRRRGGGVLLSAALFAGRAEQSNRGL